MKKSIVTLSMALVTLFGFSAFAQQQDQKQCDKVKTEKCCKGDKERKCESKQQCAAFNPFEGIQLTQEQQTKLDALKQNCKMDRKQKSEVNKDDKANRPSREELIKQRKQAKRDYLNQVKEILTPEQYVSFLENMVVNSPAGHNKSAKMDKRGHKDHKGFKKDDRRKGDGDRQVKPERKQK
ncbi:MAG: hypothetical protein K2M07_08100 [Muribaculaceae bacterium]|nr:hypothetical protein [Muribaculaceae bacterium]